MVSGAGHHMGVASDQDLVEVVRRERQLLDPNVRILRDKVEALLHPGFLEHGASGQVWDRASMIEALRRRPEVSGEALDFSPMSLGEHVVLLTYRLTGPMASLRSSVWMKDQQGNWRLRFHQGTRMESVETLDG